MLAVLAGVAFVLPLLAGLGEALGASRPAAVAGSLALALIAAVAVIAARRRRSASSDELLRAGRTDGVGEQAPREADDARV